jgi:hypothetical protein
MGNRITREDILAFGPRLALACGLDEAQRLKILNLMISDRWRLVAAVLGTRRSWYMVLRLVYRLLRCGPLWFVVLTIEFLVKDKDRRMVVEAMLDRRS